MLGKALRLTRNDAPQSDVARVASTQLQRDSQREGLPWIPEIVGRKRRNCRISV
jgi:hypothetical protein